MNGLSRSDIDEILRLLDQSDFDELRLEMGELIPNHDFAAHISISTKRPSIKLVPTAVLAGSGLLKKSL